MIRYSRETGLAKFAFIPFSITVSRHEAMFWVAGPVFSRLSESLDGARRMMVMFRALLPRIGYYSLVRADEICGRQTF